MKNASAAFSAQATGRMKLTAASLRQTLGQQSLVGLLLAVGLTGANISLAC